MTDSPDAPVPPAHPVRPADAPPSVDTSAPHEPPGDEAERQAQETLRSISRLEESN